MGKEKEKRMDDLLEIRNDGTAKPANSFWINEEGKAKNIEKSPDSNAALIDHANRDLAKAYEKDIERKMVREDELQAARDYMKVLLEEVEECNRQIAAKDEEIARLKKLVLYRDRIHASDEPASSDEPAYRREAMEVERIESPDESVSSASSESTDSSSEALEPSNDRSSASASESLTEEISENDDGTGSGEIRELPAEVSQSIKEKSGFNISMFIMVLELVMILVLILALILPKGLFGRKDWDKSNIPSTQSAVSSDDTSSAGSGQAKGTVRYRDNLASVASKVDVADKGFTCTTTVVDELEYLSFVSKDITVSYKNEYYSDDMRYRKTVVVEHNGERISFSKGYDLSGDLEGLCPTVAEIGKEKYLLFIDKAGDSAKGVPSTVRLISVNTLAAYVSNDIGDQLSECFAARMLQGQQGEDSSSVIGITVNSVGYKFSIPVGLYDTLMFGGQKVPDLSTNFVLDSTGREIKWSSVVMLGDELYLGLAEGRFDLAAGGIGVVCEAFRPFVSPDSYDLSEKNALKPFTYIPSEVTVATGFDGTEYYVPYSDEAASPLFGSMNLDDSDPNNHIYYDDDGNKTSYRGIDVANYHGRIDWETVADSGIDFAMIRMGYRKMNVGGLETDDNFKANISGADLYGINVGIYFGSQAVNEKEAIEEAEYVINSIRGYNVTYPVVIDLDYVSTYTARSYEISAEERTKVCLAFCKRIREAGYKPMISADETYLLLGMHIGDFNGIDIRYKQTSPESSYPYSYTMLRYSSDGDIAGVPESCGLDVSFVDYSAQD